MSCKTLREEKRLAKNVMFSQRCLGIVLKRVTDRGPFGDLSNGVGGESTSTASTCSAGHAADPNAEDWMFESGYLIFQDFQEENRHCFWNQTLVDALNNVEYMGFVAPGTLLIGGNEYYLEGIRSAWARRVLKPPANYNITRLGDVTGFDIQVIPQIQFTPLPEALCLVVSDLNQQGETASLHVICVQLRERFSDMIVPNEDIIYTSLGKLIKDRKIYHTGDGYFIVTPETYRLTTMSPLPERPILMTNEEALHKLHGNELRASVHKVATTHRSRSIQANMDEMAKGHNKSPEKTLERSTTPARLERFGSMRLSRKEKSHSSEEEAFLRRRDSLHLSPERSKSLVKDINLKTSPAHQDIDKGEKVSVFHKLFRRSSSKRRKGSKSPTKYATFSAQFPPLEWGDPNYIHFQSRATQTLDQRTPKDKLSSTHSLRSKTDSLTRLRDQEKRHYKSHTADLEFSHAERQSRLDNAIASPSRSSQKSSSVPRRSFPSSSTPDTPSSPKKMGGNSASLSRTEKRHRRAESCILVSSTKERNKKSQSSSPEKQSIHSKEKTVEELRLNNSERVNDENHSVTESFGSNFSHSSTLPKTKVAPYRIVPSNPSSPQSSVSVMNNSPEKTISNSSIPKWDASTPIKCVNRLSLNDDKSEKNLMGENESTSNPKSLHRLSTSSSIGYDFDVTFTSLAAQKILKGASINSIDTLLEVNMAAEKMASQTGDSNFDARNKETNISTEMGSNQILNNIPSIASYKGMNLFSHKIKNQTNGNLGTSNTNEVKLVNSSVAESKKNKADQSTNETKVLGVI